MRDLYNEMFFHFLGRGSFRIFERARWTQISDTPIGAERNDAMFVIAGVLGSQNGAAAMGRGKFGELVLKLHLEDGWFSIIAKATCFKCGWSVIQIIQWWSFQQNCWGSGDPYLTNQNWMECQVCGFYFPQFITKYANVQQSIAEVDHALNLEGRSGGARKSTFRLTSGIVGVHKDAFTISSDGIEL